MPLFSPPRRMRGCNSGIILLIQYLSFKIIIAKAIFYLGEEFKRRLASRFLDTSNLKGNCTKIHPHQASEETRRDVP